MSVDSLPIPPAAAPACRKDSDLGKVFPSGVRIAETSYGFGVFTFAFIPKGTPIARVPGHIISDPDYGSDYCIDAGEGKVLEPGLPFCYLNHACEPNCQLMHYVREEDASESEELDVGELSESEMDFDEDDLSDVDGIYSEVEDVNVEESEEGDEEEDANVVEMFFEDDTDAEIWIESLRDIMPNEELTIDYAWSADRAMKCLCGTPKCRGWIVDSAELDKIADLDKIAR